MAASSPFELAGWRLYRQATGRTRTGRVMNRQAIQSEAEIETPTGKGAGDENFPVGSFLIAPRLRPHVMHFYAFARAADDIADNPALTPEEKIRRLDQMEAGLDGPGPDKARLLAESLNATGVTDRHARDLLVAFRQDAVQTRYDDWKALLGYCDLSANPVGRFLMDLHGEDRALWSASDALCTVLQILNHLQDCQDDYRQMNRVYLPSELLVDVSVLDLNASTPSFRAVLDEILTRCDALLEIARTRPVRPRSRRLAAEMGVITRLAARLKTRLANQDPLAARVALSKLDFAVSALGGVWTLIWPGRP